MGPTTTRTPPPRRRSRTTWTATPTRSGCATRSTSRPRSSAPSASPTAAGGSRSTDGADRGVRLPRRRQRPPLGPALRRLPRRASTARRIHSHHYLDPTDPLDLHRQARARRRDRQQRGRHHLRALAQGRGRARSSSRPAAAPGSCRSTCSGKPLGKLVKTSPHLPAGLQRWLAQSDPLHRLGPDGGLRAAHAQPQLPRGAPDRLQRAAAAARLGRRDREAERRRAARRHASTSRTAPASEFDAIVYATGYNITFPFFDPDFLSAPDNRLPLYKRIFKPGIDDLALDRLRAGDADAVPVRRAAGKLVAALRRRRLRPARRGRDGGGDLAPTSAATWAHVADRPRHTMQVDYYLYEHDIRTESCPPGAERAPGGMAPKLARRRAEREGARGCLSAATSSFTSGGETLRRLAPTWARATAARARPGGPASSWPTGSAARATRACCPSPRLSPRPGSTRCCSTTAASATRPASRASSAAPPRHRDDYRARRRFRTRARRRRSRANRPLGDVVVGRPHRLRRRRRPAHRGGDRHRPRPRRPSHVAGDRALRRRRAAGCGSPPHGIRTPRAALRGRRRT